eukprot:NODE_325_length_2235_cov_11.594694_g257_i0.p1 GENE.NODE_325_length_2235_cov_11.594694_g257_i0~~NODE_325_length_2235_cov_11.594694_g257_i0.p1  ORF type:complete len:595 (-),score=70.29 NODE_325_length_2235_cov_11.594694_g257_i0:172-1956(-)
MMQSNGLVTCSMCSSTGNCNGRAASISVQANQCVCVCQDQWLAASSCLACPPQYDQGTCSRCGPGYAGNFPNCEACSTAVHCSSRATSAVPNVGQTKCNCFCEPGYTGESCNQCAPGYVRTSGQGGILSCRACAVGQDCNGRGLGVVADPSGNFCQCQCQGQWRGPDCSQCDTTRFTTTCDACRDSNAINFPNCEPCTPTVHCNGRAVAAVASVDRTSCLCTCTAGFGGTRCQCDAVRDCGGRAAAGFQPGATNCAVQCLCDEGYTGVGCSQCAPNYVGNSVIGCAVCSLENNCGGAARASSVVSVGNSCRCTCVGQWAGTSCQTCDFNKYNAACSGCVSPTAINYPICRECRLDTDCNGRGIGRITANAARTACECSGCQPGFAPPSCTTCATGYVSFNFNGGISCLLRFTSGSTPQQASAFLASTPFAGDAARLLDGLTGAEMLALTPQDLALRGIADPTTQGNILSAIQRAGTPSAVFFPPPPRSMIPNFFPQTPFFRTDDDSNLPVWAIPVIILAAAACICCLLLLLGLVWYFNRTPYFPEKSDMMPGTPLGPRTSEWIPDQYFGGGRPPPSSAFSPYPPPAFGKPLDPF